MAGDLNPTRDAIIELCPWQADWIPPATQPYQSYIGKSSGAVQNQKAPVTKVPLYGRAPYAVAGYPEFTVGCKLFVDLLPQSVTTITVTNGGANFTTAPSVTITPVSGGTGATAVAIINTAGQVVFVIVTNGGVNYAAAPTIGFSGGGGTGAAATASISEYSTAFDFPMLQKPQIKMRLSPLGAGASSKKPFFTYTVVPETVNMELPENGLLSFAFQAQGSGSPTPGAY